MALPLPGAQQFRLGQHFQAQCGDVGVILTEMWELKPPREKNIHEVK